MSSLENITDPVYIGIVLVRNLRDGGDKEENILGFIRLTNINVTASILRNHLVNQLSGIPASFNFLTKNRWPVQQNQEISIDVSLLLTQSHSVYIQTAPDTNRVGIISVSGKALGFVFIDYNLTLVELRTCIEQQLQELSGSYKFLDYNKWPITQAQEKQLTIFNVIKNCEVIIEQICSKKRKIKHTTFSGNPGCALSEDKKTLVPSSERPSPVPPQPLNHEASSNETVTSSVPMQSTSNAIFISYVRAEAYDHALCLKRLLFDRGIGVYLDVDEIKAGTDWQDSLNEALHTCKIFVALVTEWYGKTKWSNREVKVADMNNKVIIPISFLKNWPPDCLAIQFASTHYIPWKDEHYIQKEIKEGEEERAYNINFWDTQHVNKVADGILEKYYALSNNSNPDVDSSESTPVSGSFKSNAYEGFTPSIPKMDVIAQKFIVISVHPNQKSYAHELRLKLGKENYDVWCSTDTCDFTENCNLGATSPAMPSVFAAPTVTGSYSPNAPVGPLANGDTHQTSPHKHELSLFARRNGKRLSFSSSNDGFGSFSQMSDTSSLSPDKRTELQIFKNRIRNADVVILLLSEDFINSKLSKDQAYYCEHRKKIIPVDCGNVTLTPWMTSLLDNSHPIIPLKDINKLKKEINKSLSSTVTGTDDLVKENKFIKMVKCTMDYLKEPLCNCVYIAGSSKFYNAKSESICHAIGLELASIDFVALVTGGFYGVGESVGRNFCEERQILRKPERIFHILPTRDSLKFENKARQDEHGKFLQVPFGKTIFIGENVRERECLVARLFNICILIEGGPGAAHEVEQFIWNDHTVIPLFVTGGAASGKYGVPAKISVCPPGVSDSDWAILKNDTITPEEIAVGVKKIVCSMHKSRGITQNNLPRISKKQRPKSLQITKQNTLPLKFP